MKFRTLLTTCLVGSVLATSCIKEEGLDREADIVSISIEDKGFLTSIINEKTQEISLVMEGDISNYEYGIIVPKIEVSPSAIVNPKSYEPTPLNNYKHIYTVTAEDRSQKNYMVSVVPYIPLKQDFESWNIIDSNPKKIYEQPADPMWVNANEGVLMLYRDNEPFPTRSSDEIRPDSEGRKSVLLETVLGNESKSLGLMDIPVYAGNMYRGAFDPSIAMSDPLSTTKFGQPHPAYLGKALALVAYYKYTSGSPYITYNEGLTDVKTRIFNETRKDKPDVYAVLYKVPRGDKGRDVYLTANDIKTSEMIVATAFMTEADKEEKAEWTKLETKFTYREELDFDNYDYKLTVVLSSSEEGGRYMGAPGSRLYVDDLRVVCEVDEDADEYR